MSDETKNQFAWLLTPGQMVRINGRWMKLRPVMEPRGENTPEGTRFLGFYEAEAPPPPSLAGFYGAYDILNVEPGFYTIEIPRGK